MSNPENIQISLRVDPEFYRNIKIAAVLVGVSLPQYVKVAIEEKLASEAEQYLEQANELVNRPDSTPAQEIAD